MSEEDQQVVTGEIIQEETEISVVLEDHKSTTSESNSVIERRPTIIDMIMEKQNDQDFKQKTNVFVTLMLEIYRVLMGAFLIAFVPQKCGDTICTLGQNLGRTDNFSIIVVTMNGATFLVFLILYFIEVKRENKLITYLEVNRFTPVDNESVGLALENLDIKKRNSLLNYDKHYRNTGYVSTVSFVINTIFSIMNIYRHYYGSKTLTVLLTNVLFMGLKVSDVFNTVNTKKNVFYSAYLTNKVQFNDVDPDKKLNPDI